MVYFYYVKNDNNFYLLLLLLPPILAEETFSGDFFMIGLFWKNNGPNLEGKVGIPFKCFF